MNVIADVDKLREARGKRTRADVAMKVGVSVHTIREIERGRRQPSLSVAMKLASAYRKPVEQLVRADG